MSASPVVNRSQGVRNGGKMTVRPIVCSPTLDDCRILCEFQYSACETASVEGKLAPDFGPDFGGSAFEFAMFR